MNLTLYEIDFRPLHARAGRPDRGWSRLDIKFADEAEHHPSVRIVLLQTISADTTVAELERGATSQAKTILQEALRLLEAQDVTSLVAAQDERDDAALKQPLNLEGP
jgi:hypothetical protein